MIVRVKQLYYDNTFVPQEMDAQTYINTDHIISINIQRTYERQLGQIVLTNHVHYLISEHDALYLIQLMENK